MASNENALSSGDLSDRNAEERRPGGPHSAYEGPLRVSPALTLIADRSTAWPAIEVLSRQCAVPPRWRRICTRSSARATLAALAAWTRPTRIVEIGSRRCGHPLGMALLLQRRGILAIPRLRPSRLSWRSARRTRRTLLDFLKTASDQLATTRAAGRVCRRADLVGAPFLDSCHDRSKSSWPRQRHAASGSRGRGLYRRDLAATSRCTAPAGCDASPPAAESLLLGDRRRTVKLTAPPSLRMGWARLNPCCADRRRRRHRMVPGPCGSRPDVRSRLGNGGPSDGSLSAAGFALRTPSAAASSRS